MSFVVSKTRQKINFVASMGDFASDVSIGGVEGIPSADAGNLTQLARLGRRQALKAMVRKNAEGDRTSRPDARLLDRV